MLPRYLQTTEINADAKPCWITDNQLFQYHRCGRRAFLDLYGDTSLRDSSSDYLLKLRQDSAEHRQEVLQDYQPLHEPDAADRIERAAATEQLMRQGVDYISRGVLVFEIAPNLRLVSSPDLLIRQPGNAYFGEWHYVPADIKFGKKPKLEYQLIAAFHAYVLAEVQGRWPEASLLMLRSGKAYEIDLPKQLPRMEVLLKSCIETFQQTEIPEVFIAHSRCDLCPWFSYCHQEARAQRHLSLIPGVTPARYPHLQAANLTTLSALAQAQPSQLTSLPGFGEQVAEKLVYQAQAVLMNKAIARISAHSLYGLPLAPTDLPTGDIELYFDIEAAPDKNLVYLHGVLVVDRRQRTESFHALLAEEPDQERIAWEQFRALVQRYPEAPIYHFCPYEAQTVRRLAEEFGMPLREIRPLLARFVDVHKCFTDAVTLPIESYALKHIARWIGFNWRDSGANGAQSICWYDDWLASGDRAHLEAILRYNEDDCRATYSIKEWLVNFAQPFWQEGNAG
ncbi:MAG: TM0106 family RecB-like putative nuclease [Leptolyngbyaceae cyanobacterium SM1_1_3]|nr:TM0106 family RecB-like putative nuclease [Leptolyngbyaceae cyanobacterium SM1_1_3]NJO10245.1 TM0106 family RecB-like putative nuclease [Leptolyngbyaceae cyanobacterium SL_1_1]